MIGKANKIPQWERGLREDGEEKDVEGKDVEGKDGEGKDVGLGANIQVLGSSHVLLDVQSCTSTALSIVSVSICLLLTVVLAAAVLCNVLKRCRSRSRRAQLLFRAREHLFIMWVPVCAQTSHC